MEILISGGVSMIFEDAVLGRDEFIQHANNLAARHRIVKMGKSLPKSVPVLLECLNIINGTFNRITMEYELGKFLMPAEEWIFDNYYVISEQMLSLKRECQGNRNIDNRIQRKELPFIESDGDQPIPRIFAISKEIVSHTDGFVDENAVLDFLVSYQKAAPLSTHELSELDFMLKFSLLGKISFICLLLDRASVEKKEAEKLFVNCWENKDKECKTSSKMLEIWLASKSNLTPGFAEAFLKFAAEKSEDTDNFRRIIEKKLAGRGITLDQLIAENYSQKVSLGVSIGNSVTSLKNIASFEWTTLLDKICRIEQILLKDPAGIYPLMTRNSRSEYIRIIEDLAREIDVSGEAVALSAIELSCSHDQKDAESHVGYYILGKNITKLRKSMTRRTLKISEIAPLRGNGVFLTYLSLVAILTVMIAFVPVEYIFMISTHMFEYMWQNLAVAIIFLTLISFLSFEIAVKLTSNLFATIYPPAQIPSMDYNKGLPEDCSVMIIIPTLITDKNRVKELCSQLEVAWLSNPDENIYFALVGDLKDSLEMKNKDDNELLKYALECTEQLNKTYQNKRFYFFCREREYSKSEKKWMGWERKRGALEFNRLITMKNTHHFTTTSCTKSELPKIKYILTLDADTILPPGTVCKMAGIMAHPLNKPVVVNGIVESGYGMLQPAVLPAMSKRKSTKFVKIFCNDPGIDSYSGKLSELYFDIAEEGIFTGKGMYDPLVFNAILDNYFVDEEILSHDLLEGSYLRTAYVSEIRIYDNYPGNYEGYMKRLHRWTRGDWQLIPHLSGKIKTREAKQITNPLSFLSQWKISDNLRRSMLPAITLLTFILGMWLMPSIWIFWYSTLFIISFLQLIMEWTYEAFIKSLIELVFLPFRAFYLCDAAFRALWRLKISHKKLLSWVTAADSEKIAKGSLLSYVKLMWPSFIFAILVPGVTTLLWFAAPILAWYLGRKIPEITTIEKITDDQKNILRVTQRKIWAFYEDFATQADNWLPPDNVQFEPVYMVAHRTSPTNIGFLIISAIAARDLGYITLSQLLERLKNIMETIDKMEKWKGHLFNWYDTISLNTLHPRFVSTVDSGNMVACLLTTSQALREYKTPTKDFKIQAQGLLDLIHVLNLEDSVIEKASTIFIVEFITTKENDKSKWFELLALYRQYEEIVAGENSDATFWRHKLKTTLDSFEEEAASYTGEENEMLNYKIDALIERMSKSAMNMDFKCLFSAKRGLFYTGFDVDEARTANSFYDMIVSEARLTSYLAIAKGDVQAEHWFKMGRRYGSDGKGILLSWGGTGFEYLMPELFMWTYPDSLWDETLKMAVEGQINYAKMLNIPWGISESGFNSFDVNMSYKYKAFGVPGLGLKRGLDEDRVIAPYASLMAAEKAPLAIFPNLEIFKKMGAVGRYGFYEAIDYTKGRNGIVQSFMAHHQGMAFIALTNFIISDVFKERFHKIPLVKSCECLLQEKKPINYGKERWMPKPHNAILKKKEEKEDDVCDIEVREFGLPSTVLPDCHLLSNGDYQVLINTAGAGYSKYGVFGVTRWGGGISRENDGVFTFIRNIADGNVWGSTMLPVLTRPDSYRATFYPDRAVFNRKDGLIETETIIAVSSEENAEVRLIELINHSDTTAALEITSFAEISLAAWKDYYAHPAYSDLFVETQYIKDKDCIIAHKPARNKKDKDLWVFFVVCSKDNFDGEIQFETDTMAFVGRNRDISKPFQMEAHTPLSGQIGSVICPCVALRGRVQVTSGSKTAVYFTLGITESYEEAIRLADKFHSSRNCDRVFDMARTRCTIEKDYTGIKVGERNEFLKILPHLVYISTSRTLYSQVIARCPDPIRELWCFGISGDNPLITVFAHRLENEEYLAKMIRLWSFLSFKGFDVDMAIVADESPGYLRPLREMVERLVARALSGYRKGRGSLFVVNNDLAGREGIDALVAGAVLILRPSGSQLSQKALAGRDIIYRNMTYFKPVEIEFCSGDSRGQIDGNFDNGYGVFDAKTNEYYIRAGLKATPLPWINVITGNNFGFTVSEVGSGSTWNVNSSENRLTPWSNRQVQDPSGEAIYIRNTTGAFWTATPAPAYKSVPYDVRHGFGYTTFSCCASGVESHLTVFAALQHPVKISLLYLTNITDEPVDLKLFYYIKPVLGNSVNERGSFTVSKWDSDNNSLLINNNQNNWQGQLTAFISSNILPESWTGDDMEFKGLYGSLSNPAAVDTGNLSGNTGGGLNACGAIQFSLHLEPKEKCGLVFLLGQTADIDSRKAILESFRNPFDADLELQRVKKHWYDLLNVIQIDTPDKSLNIMMNGWLLYQVVSCRLYGRTAFYQSGGAIGFRDQLQDSLALLNQRPELVRAQILLHASRQFEEGDVQHWWHTPTGAGIRSRYSDDLLWLPYCTWQYIVATGDYKILDERISFLKSNVLEIAEHERYEVPVESANTDNLYGHCILAIEKSLEFGAHGLPLIKGGDWNDGMNLVGIDNKGESVWLAWFLCTILDGMGNIAQYMGDSGHANKFSSEANRITDVIEEHCWDGGWYLRAFYDDGTSMGGLLAPHCSIDSISQSWSAISGRGSADRVKTALFAAERQLVDWDNSLVRLLTPPFSGPISATNPNPGYISKYPPGIRENGAQYTHGSIWLAKAMLSIGEVDKGYNLLSIMNPINHGRTSGEINRYRAEPYVIAGDVYSEGRNIGRGGWSWYTGAAAWMYRTILEDLLGIVRRENKLEIHASLPSSWQGFNVDYHFGSSVYRIQVKRVANPSTLKSIDLVDDGVVHVVQVEV